MIESSYIRMQLGAEGLKTLRHDYKVLDLVNSLQGKVFDIVDDDEPTHIKEFAQEVVKLMRIVVNDYGMVSAKDEHDPKYKSHFKTFKGEHDEWKEMSDANS
tara:strand:- start:255 stop:560 length:306 start_codon:yes stop_codon:yes gene_type:complete